MADYTKAGSVVRSDHLHTFPAELDYHTIEDSPFQLPIPDRHTVECSVRRVKVVGTYRVPYMRDLVETQWDHVGDGPLETVAYLARRTRVGRVCGLKEKTLVNHKTFFGAEKTSGV